MPLLSTYKDFAIPQFFQGPKFNFLKEVEIGNPSKPMRKHHEDEKKIFDFIQEWPINNDNDPDLDIPENDKD